jgi:hypothetical protein
VLLNDAKSDASAVKSLLNVAKSWPDSPAALPNVPNVPAANKTAFCDCPKEVAAVLAKFSYL